MGVAEVIAGRLADGELVILDGGTGSQLQAEGVPMDDSEREVDWELRAAGGNQFTLDPYPFRRAPLEFSILARRVPKRRYLDDADFQHVLSTAPFFQMRFTLRPGASQERSYAVGM